MNREEVYGFLKSQVTPLRLKELSLEIIDAYKSKDWAKIQLYADSVFGDSGHSELEGSKVFLKLIKFFHPDRIEFLVKDIENSYEKNNLKGLTFYKNLLSADTLVAKAYNERFDLDIAEMYHYDEEDFRDYMPNTFDDFDEDELREVEEYNDFLTAMKCEYIGSPDFPLDLADLASFEGEVSLTDYNIHDLEGVQYCKKITGLNLSNNCISSMYHIQFLENLEELFVSNNEISHIEYLSGMHSLRILDLSYNAVEDIAPLLHLEGLQFVNLEKNPLQNTHLTEELEARSVVVIR